MAKIKAKNDRFGRARPVLVKVLVNSSGGVAGNFKACAFVDRARKPIDCQLGQNPRKAVANVLVAAAKKIHGRSGSFAGAKVTMLNGKRKP